MQHKELRNFVAQIVEQKQLTGVEQDIKDKLIDDLSSMLEDQINRALIDSLNDEQFKEFEQLVDSNSTQRLSTFFTDHKLPVQHIVTQVMTKFRMTYLGTR
jgi:hypothetical protein